MKEKQIQFYVHLDQELYDDIEDLLASHTSFTTIEGLRHLIIQVARKLEMDLDKDDDLNLFHR